MIKPFPVLFAAVFLAGCAVQSISLTPTQPASAQASLPSTAREAQGVLVDFLTLLHTKNYTEAVALYDGEYDALQVFNPELDPNDLVSLWTWACDHQLLQCLEIRSVTFQEQRGDTYIFQVEFNNPDGSLFVRGPCCGANETEMPSVSQFEFTVTRNSEGKFVVMNAPPYVP